MMKRGWLLLTLLALDCSKCGKAPAGNGHLEAVLPRGAIAVVGVTDLAALGEKLKLVENLKVASFVAPFEGFTDAHQWADALVSQFGLDPRKKETLENAGLRPNGEVGSAVMLDGSVLLALPVKDEGKLRAALQKISASRLGAGVEELKVFDGAEVHTFAHAAGEMPRLGYVMVQGFALVATDGTVQKLSAWAALPAGDAVAKDESYAAASARLPKARDLWVYLPPGSPALKGGLTQMLAVASLTPDALTVTIDAPTADAKLLALFAKKDAVNLLGLAPADAFLSAQYSGDSQALAAFADSQVLGPYLRRALDEGGFDLKKEIFDNLKPGSMAAISLAATAKLDRGVPQLDFRRTNPFSFVHLAGAAEVTDAAKAAATLEKVAALAPKFGATITASTHGDDREYVTSYAQGEGVNFALHQKTVFFASPKARLEALLDAKTSAAVAAPAQAFTIAIDLKKLADAVRGLSPQAWGLGGFAIKASTLRWLDASDDLKAISIGVEAKQAALQATIELHLGKATPQ